MAAQYDTLQGGNNHHQVYGTGDPHYNESTGFITPQKRKRTSPWIKFGIPVLVVVIIVAVVVGVVVSRNHKSSSSSSTSSSSDSSSSAAAQSASSAVSAKLELGRFATATNSEWMMPIYPSTTNAAAFTTPTFINSSDSQLAWPSDSFSPPTPAPTSVRPDRPRVIAPAYKWAALPTLIKNDPYLQGWNATIFGNATDWYSQPPVVYAMDGSSGILDVARQVKERIKAFAYVHRMTNDTKWVDRAFEELQNAAGNGTGPVQWGPANDRWNQEHFLDTAELSSAFGIGYDWLYDSWTDLQKSQIRTSLIQNGLEPGIQQYTNSSNFNGWWQKNITGNWNCVSNAGLTIGSLAILDDDTTGIASQLLGLTITNAKENCALAVSDDGTWDETSNYWYFGTTGHAEMSSALLTATGSDYGLLDVNSNFYKTGIFHMYAQGSTSRFNYGDHGPNKFSTTANAMFLYASQFNQPQFSLYQREQSDAADPWSMFWYDPTVTGAFWDGLALDHYFNNSIDEWASMRASWTDINSLFVAMKAGTLQGHQTHNDLDVGDFVLDAMGTRWAGELGSGDYNSIDYFSNDTQISGRWLYYRKMTEGQNTILINEANQNVLAAPVTRFESTNEAQGSSTVYQVPSDSTAYFVADMTSAYFSATSVKRGVRTLNARKQVLIQDEITASEGIQWRMHTNATISLDTAATTATLSLDGQTLEVKILSPSSGATFTTSDAVRFPTDPVPPQPDQDNTGVKVLIISLPAGTYNLQVLFNPQWSDGTTLVTPPSVNLDDWSLTSHN